MTSTQQQQDHRRITWRVGAAGVLVGAALVLAAGAVTFQIVSSPAPHRVDVIVPESTASSPAPVAPTIEVTPAPDAPTPAPRPANTAPLDQRVDHLEQRVDNLETTTTSTTLPTPTTVDNPGG